MKTTKVCAQSQVHNAEITDASINEVLTVSDDQVKVDVSDDSHVHCPEINDNNTNDVHMLTGDPVNVDISKGSVQNAEDAENDGQQNMDKDSEEVQDDQWKPVHLSSKACTKKTKTKIKLHKCKESHLVFNRQSSLFNHKKVHMGQRYRCLQYSCPFTTVSLSMYNEHVKYGHLSQKIIECSMCTIMFQTPSKMYSHRNRAHGPVRK